MPQETFADSRLIRTDAPWVGKPSTLTTKVLEEQVKSWVETSSTDFPTDKPIRLTAAESM